MTTLSKTTRPLPMPWDPFKQLAGLESGLERFFGRFPRSLGNGAEHEPMSTATWSPLTDITEDDKEFLLKAELPEVKKEDVKVSVEKGVLRISGERRFEKEEKEKTFHRVERGYGSFLRAFTLPEEANSEKVSADFKDGVLMVHVPKSEKALPKAIEVKVA